MLDRTIHPDEYRFQEKSQKRLSKELLQAHEQLSFRQNNGNLRNHVDIKRLQQ